MILKPKTARRLLLLGAVLVVAIASAVGFFFVRSWQLERRFEEYRATGVAALEKGEYAEAINNLGRYLRNKRYENDRDALLSYAKAREALEEKDFAHLTQAIGIYERALSLDPSDVETRRKLLTLYNDTGFWQEALDHANRLLPERLDQTTEKDVEALRGRITAMIGLRPRAAAARAAGDNDAALEAAIDRLVELKPDDLNGHLLKAGLIQEKQSQARAVEYARRIAAAHPGDVSFKIFEALTAIDPAGIDEEQVATICSIVGLDRATARFLREPTVGDETTATRLVFLFDAMGMPRHALAIADAALAAHESLELRRVVLRRAWSLGRADRVLELTEKLDPATAHPEVLAFRALTLLQQNKPGEAAPIAAALRDRQSSYQARVWAPLLTALTAEPPVTGRDLITAADDSLKQNAGEPILHYFRGNALADVDRLTEARDAWQTAAASGLAVGWAAPVNQITDSFLAERRWEDALRAAEAAYLANPQDIAVQINLVLAQASMIENGYSLRESPDVILSRIDTALAGVRYDSPEARRVLEESLLPARVLLAARSNQRDRALSLISDYINTEGPRNRPLLERLARLSIAERLGVEDEILAAAESTGGRGPFSDLVRALTLARAGDDAAGLALLEAGRDAAGTQPGNQSKVRYEVAIAQYKEAIGDPAATTVWAQVTDAHPDNLDVQATALQSDAALRDSALAEKLIGRFMTLSGADPARPPVQVRLARARAILAQPTITARERDEALGIVRAVVTDVPTLVAGRQLLIAALLRQAPEVDGQRAFTADLAGATEQLQALIPLVPDPIPIRLQLASILAERNDTSGAREEFIRIAADPAVDIASRETAAIGLVALREFAASISPLEAVVRERGDEASDRVLIALARAYEATRALAQSTAIMRRLAGRTITDPAVIAEVADSLAFAGDTAAAASVLDKLEPLELPRVDKLRIRADFLTRHGDREAAARVYEEMIAAAPDQPDGYVALASFRLGDGDVDAARAVAERAPDAIRNSPELRVMRQQIELTGRPQDQIDFKALAEALEGSEQFAVRAQAVRALDALSTEGRLDDPDALLAVARRFRTEPTVQTIITRLLLSQNPPALRQAAALATEAMATFPGNIEIAEMAARSFAGAQQWEAMLSAAQTWAALSRDSAADLAVAEAHLGARRPNQAVAVLAPLVAGASEQPENPLSAGIITAYARALIQQRDDRRAAEVIEPLMAREPSLRRTIWIPLAANEITTVATARAWLDRIRPSLTNEDEIQAAALAYLTLGERFPEASASLATEAIAVMSPRAAASSSPINLTILGAAQQAAGDRAAAIASYRAALAQDPVSLPALPRLVDLLGSDPATAEEAVSVARSAFESQPAAERPVGLTVVLARAHAAAAATGSGPAAAEHFRASLALFDEAAAAAPADIELQAQAASVAEAAGDYAAAVRFYKRVLANPPANPQFVAVMQNNAAYAMFRAGAAGDELVAARDLARTAAATLPEAPIFDTLGHLEVATGSRNAGIDAFRRALQRQADLVSAKIGLALSLSSGSPAEKDEARNLLADVDQSSLQPSEKAEYDAARRNLGG